MRVVRLLHQSVRFHAYLATARVHACRAEIRLDLGSYPIDDFDGEQIRPGDALVAVRRNATSAVAQIAQASASLCPQRALQRRASASSAFARRRALRALTSRSALMRGPPWRPWPQAAPRWS